MHYDFTTVMNRRGMDALAVDGLGVHPMAPHAPEGGFDAIPMWVADMNFPTVPTVQEAIMERVKHPAFGYFSPRQEYFEAIQRWHRVHKGVADLLPEHIGYANGVLSGVVAAANVICCRGDKILVHSPTYVGFTHALGDAGYRLVHSGLVLDEQGVWRMDFADMERKLSAEKIHCAVLCSPHNPCGRVWERWELEAAMELFKKYDVSVISDEIWSDLTLRNYRHIPTQSLSEDAKMRTVALYAPSKTFNLAGLVGSYSVVYNCRLREQLGKEMALSAANNQNVLSMYALMGAYSEAGMDWLHQLRAVLTENVDFACDFIENRLPGVSVSKPQGTYMLFVDCKDYLNASGSTMDVLLHRLWRVGVAVQDGRQFGGQTHLRINLALPTARVQEAFRRMQTYGFTV